MSHYSTMIVRGGAVVASDLHCMPGSCPARTLAGLAIEYGVEALVILGDLFEDMHRRVSVGELRRALRWVFGGVRNLTVHYVASRSSHDPILDGDVSLEVDGVEIHVYSRPVIAVIGGVRAFLTHGDMALRNGAHAYLVNLLAAVKGERLYLEKRLKRRLRLPREWWLVMGHTHIPGIDYRERVANTGSWRSKWILQIPYWRPPSNTFLLVGSGTPILLSYSERVGVVEEATTPRRQL